MLVCDHYPTHVFSQGLSYSCLSVFISSQRQGVKVEMVRRLPVLNTMVHVPVRAWFIDPTYRHPVDLGAWNTEPDREIFEQDSRRQAPAFWLPCSFGVPSAERPCFGSWSMLQETCAWGTAFWYSGLPRVHWETWKPLRQVGVSPKGKLKVVSASTADPKWLFCRDRCPRQVWWSRTARMPRLNPKHAQSVCELAPGPRTGEEDEVACSGRGFSGLPLFHGEPGNPAQDKESVVPLSFDPWRFLQEAYLGRSLVRPRVKKLASWVQSLKGLGVVSTVLASRTTNMLSYAESSYSIQHVLQTYLEIMLAINYGSEC